MDLLPDDWEFVSSKRLFQQRSQLASVDDAQLAATQAYGVIEQTEYERRIGRKVVKLNKNLDKRRRVERDDFIISMRSFEGGLERAWAEGGIRSSYIVLKPAAPVCIDYFEHLFKSQPYIQALRATGNFIRDGQDLNYSNFALVDLPYPPLCDQVLIARYLTWHGAMTARLIRAKKRLIAVLNEQRQSLIHRAMTRGLDPNAKLKPSGADWLGDVPEHWAVGHLRYLTECLDGKRIPLNGPERGGKQGNYPYWGANKVIDYLDDWLFDEPLVLLGEDGAPFFIPGRDVAFAVEGKIWVNNHAHVLRCGRRLIPPFLAAALNCVDYIHFIDGSTRDKLTQAAMGSIHIQVPPLNEQLAIVKHLSRATAEIDAFVARTNNELRLIAEFRTRLIADVVTGRLDVRTVAAELPDLSEELTEAKADAYLLDEGSEELIEEEAEAA